MISAKNYNHKTEDYFQVAQTEVLKYVQGHDNRILEIGCAEGWTGALLKSTGKASEVHGIELVPEVAERARTRLDSVIAGNLETMEFPFQDGYFDYILATETLEHLTKPEAVLERLKPLIKEQGVMIASVPNMRHIRLVWQLVIQGEWQYADSGPMDRTHMRYFTRKSFARLFTDGGYEVVKSEPVLLAKANTLNRYSLGIFEEFLAFRYYCVARKR